MGQVYGVDAFQMGEQNDDQIGQADMSSGDPDGIKKLCKQLETSNPFTSEKRVDQKKIRDVLKKQHLADPQNCALLQKIETKIEEKEGPEEGR